MRYSSRSFMLILAAAIVVLASAVGPSYAYADDGTPPAPSAEETAGGEIAGEAPPETSGDEGAPAEEQPPAEEPATPAEEQPPAEEPAAPAEEQSPAEEPAAPAGEQPVAEEPVTAAEILEQVPEGTELMVVNASGEVEPLATEAAAEIIAAGDPMWCPATTAPGGAGCTGSHPDFASLIAELAADAAGANLYTGNGTIWVEDSYAGNDNTQIAFDGLTLTNISNANLTVQGGWDGNLDTLGTVNPGGASLADVSMVFVNWTGNITINDFDIQNTTNDVGFGLWIENDGAVALNNVSVNGTTGSAAGNNDGAYIDSAGAVALSDSQFNSNDGDGLQVTSAGNITLDNVSASGNTLTGADLDTCLYNGIACQAAGNVTISGASNPFTGNGFDGLVINSGGSTNLQNIEANSNGLNGAYITNGVAGGAGDVQISDSNFVGNSNATGLEVYQYSNGPITLNNVTATGNNVGAILDTTGTTGNVIVSNSQFSSNDYTGLHAESGGNASLASVVANNNGANGGYLIADGSIAVTDSQFNDNVHFDFPQDPGLYAQAQGAITLTNVLANSNDFGAGAVLVSNNVGDINVNGGQFNENGAFGVQAENQNGGITLTSIEASYNGLKGAYLSASGGNIVIDNSTFVENGAYGIYAQTSNGNINLDTVTVTGDDGVAPNDDLTNIGAFLASGSGNIFVDNSVFELNTETGLLIVTDGQIDLLDVIADQNGDNGVEFYSNYTWGCLCPGDLPSSTIVSVDGGEFTNNGGYGLLARPGPEGDLIFVAPPTTTPTLFGGNGLGDFLLDLAFTPENCGPCECGECCEPDDPSKPKDPVIVQVDDVLEPVLQDCENTSGTIWQTPDGVWVKVGCPFKGYSLAQSLTQDGLPGPLGAGTNFEAGITVGLTDEDENIVTVNPDGSITLRFTLPTGGRGRSYSILFWDPTLNEGAGGWVQLPPFEAGTSFPLHPEDPDDPRLIIAGVQEKDGALTVTVNFPGVFVLVSR
ncbi:MAG: right-handed parallel beta-helix repeat-containing protein [Chloroflexota bacterium]